jgi:ABC-type phosphate transport system substrate-binding protein
MEDKKNVLLDKTEDQLQDLLNQTRKKWSDNRIEFPKAPAYKKSILNGEAQSLEEKMKEIEEVAKQRGFVIK